ncbi:MAG: transcriptional regulator [Chloroflexi bacterium]|nr:MAG: transcriptional regulator [Chloroflexota bacterium]
MASMAEAAPEQPIQPVYIVSGGVGASGELLTRTVLAQFAGIHAPVTVWPYTHEPGQVQEVVARAAQENALIVHTLVKPDLRRQLIDEAAAAQITSVDLVGPLMDQLTAVLQAEPLGQPGRYRTLFNSYFKRVEAIEFAVNHDDGKRVEDLIRAEIVLLGVSRVGKTPLSIYLSLQGWKVANIPLVSEVPLPAELADVPRERIVGLTIEPQQLLLHRRHRQRHLGIAEGAYADRQAIVEEIRAANHLFYSAGYAVVDITDKPIETSSEEVIAAVTRRLAAEVAL